MGSTQHGGRASRPRGPLASLANVQVVVSLGREHRVDPVAEVANPPFEQAETEVSPKSFIDRMIELLLFGSLGSGRVVGEHHVELAWHVDREHRVDPALRVIFVGHSLEHHILWQVQRIVCLRWQPIHHQDEMKCLAGDRVCDSSDRRVAFGALRWPSLPDSRGDAS